MHRLLKPDCPKAPKSAKLSLAVALGVSLAPWLVIGTCCTFRGSLKPPKYSGLCCLASPLFTPK